MLASMRATLLYNPSAGSGGDSVAKLAEVVERADLGRVDAPQYDAAHILELLEHPGDVVVAAGGDGTVAKVAIALRGRGVPMAVLPRGTANNIARTLGVPSDLDHWARSMSRPRRSSLDLGRAEGSWGICSFVESAGVGLFHHVVTERASGADKEPSRALRLIRRAVDDYVAREWRITIDGSDHSGAYVLVDAMNVQSIGPQLRIAPSAEPGDGWLDIVLVPAARRDALREYLDLLCAGKDPVQFDAGTIVRARDVKIELLGTTVRIDDRETPSPEPCASELVVLALEPSAVPLLLPSA